MGVSEVKRSVYDVFISYRWVDPDQTWVRDQLAPALRNAGLTVLLDVDDFVPGRDLLLEMARAGHDSRRVLCVLSPDYFDGNRMVAFESLMARRLDPSGSEPRLIPLMLRSSELPEWLRGLIPVDWTNPSNHSREWRKLLSVLGAPNDGSAPGPAGSTESIPELRAPSAPKYYIYISESKVNMLYAQSGTDKEANNWDSIYKLDTVLAHLARAGCIGTIDEPKEYFAGAIAMRWGPCVFPGVPEKITPTSSPLVYFGGSTKATVVGLGGSANHVIGRVGSANAGLHSCLPGFIFQLRQELGESLPLKLKSMDDDQGALMAVYMATMYGKGPTQELEFVAKRLAYGPLPSMWFRGKRRGDKEKILVGTPLYVAMNG